MAPRLGQEIADGPFLLKFTETTFPAFFSPPSLPLGEPV